jgi:hypothetical protein
MTNRNAPSRRSIDPHGYQPLVIDENVLTEDDRIEAFDAAVSSRPRNWLHYLTRQEVESFKKAINEIEQNKSPYWIGRGELPAVQEMKYEMNQLGMLRAFARDKYANGHRIWYGDGVPLQRYDCSQR